jgi:hypothetical protein
MASVKPGSRPSTLLPRVTILDGGDPQNISHTDEAQRDLPSKDRRNECADAFKRECVVRLKGIRR